MIGYNDTPDAFYGNQNQDKKYGNNLFVKVVDNKGTLSTKNSNHPYLRKEQNAAGQGVKPNTF